MLCSYVTNRCTCTPDTYGPQCEFRYNDCEGGSKELCVHGVCEDLERQQARVVSLLPEVTPVGALVVGCPFCTDCAQALPRGAAREGTSCPLQGTGKEGR